MGQLLKLSTGVDITVLMIDSADHVTGKTGLAAGLTIYLTKAAGAPAVITPTVTELDATNVKGLYKLALTTTHTNTLGEFQLHITATGADPTDVAHQVVTDLPGIAQTGDSFARIGANGAGLTALGDTRIANLDATVSSRLATAGYTAPPTAAANADAVWDEAIAGHLGAGSTGAALNAAGGSGDPWSTPLPGAYGAGTAGKIIGDNIDATISSRLATAGYTAPPSAAQNATELLDQSAGVETNRTVRQAMRLMLAALAGKLSGALTTTVTIRDSNDTKNRIIATVDTGGNRSAVTYDAS